MTVPDSIHSIIMDGVRTELELKLITEANEDIKAGLIKVGDLQDAPTKKRVNIMIHTGGKDWQHEPDTESAEGMGAYTIGDVSTMWRRRYMLEMQFFYSSSDDRDEARTKALATLQAIHNTMARMNISNFPADDFGEKAHRIIVGKNYLDGQGGKGTYIWRGYMLFEVLTEINY